MGGLGRYDNCFYKNRTKSENSAENVIKSSQIITLQDSEYCHNHGSATEVTWR